MLALRPRDDGAAKAESPRSHASTGATTEALLATRAALRELFTFTSVSLRAGDHAMLLALSQAALTAVRVYHRELQRELERRARASSPVSRLLQRHVSYCCDCQQSQLERLLRELRRSTAVHLLAPHAREVALTTVLDLEQLTRDTAYLTPDGEA